MFNRCWRWRGLLSRRADSVLTSRQWGRLQDHLASCPHCRRLVEADDALHSVLGVNPAPLSPERARKFDERVLVALAGSSGSYLPVSPMAYFRVLRLRIMAGLKDLPLSFLGQMGGGALVAGCLTSFFLLPALHSGSGAGGRNGTGMGRKADVTGNGEQSRIPVPLASLLNNPAPRAASLWSMPDERPMLNSGWKRYGGKSGSALESLRSTTGAGTVRPGQKKGDPDGASDIKLAPTYESAPGDFPRYHPNTGSPSGIKSSDANPQEKPARMPGHRDAGLLPTVIMG